MLMYGLYIDKKAGVYYYSSDDCDELVCGICHAMLQNYLVYINNWYHKSIRQETRFKNTGLTLCCVDCVKKKTSILSLQMRCVAIITPKCDLPISAMPVVFTPEFSNVPSSVFDAVYGEGNIRDHTVYSGDSSLSIEGATIGSLEYKDIDNLEYTDDIDVKQYINPLSNNELEQLLESHKTATPIIEQNKTLLLEDKNGSR